MPYAPGVEDRTADYRFQALYGGLRSLGGAVQDWQKQHDETQQKLETADLLKSYADKRGFTTPEFTAKYAAANAEQKAKMAAGLSQTIVLQAHDAEQKAEQEFRAQQLAQAWKIAQLNASTGRAAGARGPATAEEMARAQAAAPPGTTAVPTAHGWDFIQTKGAQEKSMFHQPGETYYHPVTGEPAGTYYGDRGENVKLFDEGDPIKKKIAKAMEEQQAAGAATTPSFATAHPIINALIYGRPGSLANPTPSPMPSAAPAVTPGPVIAPAVTPTPPPVAAAGSTVANIVKTQADFDALPSGAIFQAPDGSVRRKP